MGKNLARLIVVGILVLGLSVGVLAQGQQGQPGPQGAPDPGPQCHQGPPPNHPDPLKSVLGALVIDGIVNRDQALTTLHYFEKDMTAMKDMEPKQRDEFLKKNREQKKDPLSLLVKDKVLSPEQANAIEKAMFRPMPPQEKPGEGAPAPNPR